MTADHRFCHARECARVQREGGRFEGGRLNGTIEVTRALGNFEPTADGGGAKPPGLCAEPEVMSKAIASEDEFVLLATDGLWDVVSADEAVRVARAELRAYEDAQLAAEKLVEIALKRKAEDNVTVLVARLFGPRPEEAMARQIGRQLGRRVGERSHSFVELPTASNFVQVVGGFD